MESALLKMKISKRFGQLFVVSLIPLGSHCFKAFWTILAVFLIDSNTFTLYDFGFILAIEAIPSLFVPIIVGFKVKSLSSINTTIKSFLLLCSCSLFAVWICVEFQLKYLFVVSILCFGTFSCSLTPLQRVLLKHHFHDHPAFTAGVFSSVSSLSKIAAKMIVAPSVKWLRRIAATLLLPVIANCAITILVTLLLDVYCGEDELEQHHHGNPNLSPVEQKESEDEIVERDLLHESFSDEFSLWSDLTELVESVRFLPLTSATLIWVHTLYSLIFHVIINYFPFLSIHYWHYSPKKASFFVSIPSLVAILLDPVVGSLSTNIQNKSVICFAAGILSIMAFVIMIMNHNYAIMSLLFLSIAQSSLFTILLALIAIHTPIESVGIAFGLFEVLSGISNISGNIAFGYLCSIGDNCIFGLLFSLSLSVIGCCILSAFACTEMLTMPYNPVNQRYQQI